MDRIKYRSLLPAASPLLNGLIYYAKLNGNGQDSSGSGLHSISIHSSTTWVSGRLGQAMKTTVTTTGLRLNHGGLFNFVSGSEDLPFSVSFWTRKDTAWAQGWMLTNRNFINSGFPASWQVLVSNTGILTFTKFDVTSTSSNQSLRRVSANTALPINQYVMVSIVNSGIAAEIYLNDTLTPSTTVVDGVYTRMQSNSENTFSIGAASWGGSLGLNAIMDDVKIWNRVLSLSEIQYLYNSGLGREIL